MKTLEHGPSTAAANRAFVPVGNAATSAPRPGLRPAARR